MDTLEWPGCNSNKARVGLCTVYTDGQPYKPCVLCETGLKDLQDLAEFNLFRSFHLCTKNLFVQQTSDLLEKLPLIFLYNLHREHSLLKI